VRAAAAHAADERVGAALGVDLAQAAGAQARAERIGGVGGHAPAGPRAPGLCASRQPQRGAVVRECVEEGVRGGVGCLPRVADERGHRREQHEQVELVAALDGQLVQVARAGELWRENSEQAFLVEVGHRCVVQDAGRMQDTAERHTPRVDLAQEGGDGVSIGDVEASHVHARTGALELADRRARVVSGRAPATEDEVARPLRDQAPCRHETERAQAARDDVGAVRAHHGLRREGEHDLAHVARLGEVLDRLGRLLDREHARRQRA
jgi:hypothetical protein